MFTKFTSTARLLTLSVLALTLPPQLFAAGPDNVFLRSTENFVILSGAAITSTGGGSITGDVGASPIAGSGIGVTCAQMNGAIYAVDATGPACAEVEVEWVNDAKGNLTLAYNDIAGRTPVPTGPFLNPNGGNLGGQNLVPELYKFTSTALITGADLTLTGGPDDVWIFQIASDLQVGSGIKVILAGGARAANVFWQVGTSAVLGTGSDFKGTILADQSITLGTGSTMEGRAFAANGGVTFNGTSIRLPGATVPVNTPQIAVQQPAGVNLANGGSQSFGLVNVGANSSRTFTISNPGTANLTGLGITIDGADAALFTVTANPVAPVSPGGSTTFTVRFAPVSSGTKTAVLHIANNDPAENPFDLTLTGSTLAEDAPEFSVEQPPGVTLANGGSQNFGLVNIGANSSRTFTIANPGTTNLPNLGIMIDGADAALFTVTTNPVSPVTPSGSTTFTVQFAPLSPGAKTALLHIANDDTEENLFGLTLTGTGAEGEVFPSTNIVVTAESAITLNPQTGLFEQTVQLANNGDTTVPAFRLLVQSLPSDVRVYNASGTADGAPYVQHNFPVSPGSSVDLVIEYYRANRDNDFAPTFLVLESSPASVPETGPVLAINSFTNDVSGQRFLLEFSAIPGRRYAVQYSTDGEDWKTAHPIITAPANRVQWYDDGPPKTESKPTDVGSRFYQIMQLP